MMLSRFHLQCGTALRVFERLTRFQGLRVLTALRLKDAGIHLRYSKTAQDWVKHGFPPEEVWRYLEAHCRISSKSAELRSMGVTPDKAGEHFECDEDGFP